MLVLQFIEYIIETTFIISDRVYGSTFFIEPDFMEFMQYNISPFPGCLVFNG